MSSSTISMRPKSPLVVKQQSILSKLLAFRAALINLKNVNKMLKQTNTALKGENKSLKQQNSLLEAQVLQLREVVSLQAQQQMELTKALREVHVSQKC